MFLYVFPNHIFIRNFINPFESICTLIVNTNVVNLGFQWHISANSWRLFFQKMIVLQLLCLQIAFYQHISPGTSPLLSLQCRNIYCILKKLIVLFTANSQGKFNWTQFISYLRFPINAFTFCFFSPEMLKTSPCREPCYFLLYRSLHARAKYAEHGYW